MFAEGKWRIRASTLLVYLCVLISCKKADQAHSVTLGQIKAADVAAKLRGQRVTTTAEVTYSDPGWNLLFLQDDSDGVYLPPPENSDFKAGDVLNITGTTSAPKSILADTRFAVVRKDAALPQPVELANASEFLSHPSMFVSTTAVVRWVGLPNGHPTLEAFAGDRPFQAVIFPGTRGDLPRIGSEIKISGVAAALYGSNGNVQGLQLLTPSARFITVLKPGPADPFGLPLKNISQLQQLPIGDLVHVSGHIATTSAGMAMQEGDKSVLIEPREQMPSRLTAAEVAGFWNGHAITAAMLRPRAQEIPPHSDVEHLIQLKQMSAEQAEKHYSVHVQAVVTYFDPYWHLLFLQDSTAAAFVNAVGVNVALRPGDLVDVTGVSDPGDFAPVISKPIITVIGRGTLPSPVALDVVHGDLNEADSIRCTFRGIVHTARVSDGHTVLKLEAGQTALDIDLPVVINGAELVDKDISVTGALGILFNDRRQAVGHQIFVPGPESLKVLDSKEMPHPPVSIASLRRYSPNSDEHHSVTITGTVVAKSSKRVIVVQDGTAGVQVRAAGTDDVTDGDRVSVRGFILPGEYSPVLEDAVVERQSAGELPKPQMIAAKLALDGTYDSEYVQMSGTLTDVRISPRGIVLTLNDGGTFFEAAGPSSDELSSLRLGSRIAVHGICQVTLDRSSIPYAVHGFTLKFDSPESVLVLKRGPWWDAQRIGWAFLLIFALGATAVLWAALLRRQVLSKTSELQASLEAKRHAAKFDAARNQALESIVSNAPLGESMERLALAIEGQIPGCICAVVLPPDGKSFHGSAPASTLLAPNLPEEIHLALAPALSSLFNAESSSGEESLSGSDKQVMERLLQILREGGHEFRNGNMTVAFSGHGEAAGVLLLFRRNEPSHETEALEQNMMQSASRLVALASDHWRMHTRLLHEARHDSLTGLPNRTVAEDRLEQALARARRARKSFALFCIDLDGFKTINDERGHDAGDEILRAVGLRLRNSLRHSDTLARMGGDEFLVLIEDCAGETAARSVAHSLVTCLQQPFVLGGRQVSLSGSVGIAMFPADGKNATQLRRQADLAMYRAKALGGGQVALWSGEALPSGQMARKSFTS